MKVRPLATIKGPFPVRQPNTPQIATPVVNKPYIESEMDRVSSIRRVLIACGKKLMVVRAAAV